MSTIRPEGEACPLDDQERRLSMDMCQPCSYFRGASCASEPRIDADGARVMTTDGKPTFLPTRWRIVCNWPRNGSADWERSIPQAFIDAFRNDDPRTPVPA